MTEELPRFGRLAEPVDHAQPVAAPAAAVWEMLARPGHLVRCHPFCREHLVHAWPGAGSRDTVVYYSGIAMHRHLYRWLPGVGYDLEIHKTGDGPARVAWRVAPDGEAASVLSMRVEPHLEAGDDASALRALTQRYMVALLAGFAYAITTGEPVRRDQFGRIDYFSGSSSGGRE
jgi:hypothetical protein